MGQFSSSDLYMRRYLIALMSSQNNNDHTQCARNCAQVFEDTDQLPEVSKHPSKFPVANADHSSLLNFRVCFVLLLWYLFSFGAIFLNKYIIDMLRAEIIVFSGVHFLCASAMGFLNIYFQWNPLVSNSCTIQKENIGKNPFLKSPTYFKAMSSLGFLRLMVVIFTLLSLKYVSVSFMETVKSSAPLFTVVISYCLLKEKNGPLVQLSLIPIMLGLLLCTAYEISFVMTGFLAAIFANVAECMQFVVSKILLSSGGEHLRASPAELQFYTCLAALICHFPIGLFCIDTHLLYGLTSHTVLLMFVNGILYHLQTMMAWSLMQFLSPLTHSVCNTVKCALAMWLSIPLFHNPVTMPGVLGSVIVVGGVLVYNKARDYERRSRLLQQVSDDSSVLPVEYEAPH